VEGVPHDFPKAGTAVFTADSGVSSALEEVEENPLDNGAAKQ
jgi:hypothetical protein